MSEKTWYKELGFFNNPFSIKPASFHNEIYGNDDIVEGVISKVYDSNIILLIGEYGTGKTSVLKKIIDEFKGENRVIYYNCHMREKQIDFDKLLINAGGLFRKIFRIRKKDMIILLDEAQDMNKKDIERVKEYFDDEFFISVIFVAKKKDLDLIKDIEELVGENVYKIKTIDNNQAVQLVRKRIGNLKFISNQIIEKIFELNKNPRMFLKNCERVCKTAFDKGKKKVSEADLKIL